MVMALRKDRSATEAFWFTDSPTGLSLQIYIFYAATRIPMTGMPMINGILMEEMHHHLDNRAEVSLLSLILDSDCQHQLY